jgi:hypothetical protein
MVSRLEKEKRIKDAHLAYKNIISAYPKAG